MQALQGAFQERFLGENGGSIEKAIKQQTDELLL